eukprot:UN17541
MSRFLQARILQNEQSLLFQAFKGREFFHAVVLAGTPPSIDFKSIYSNQFKRYEYT